MRIGIIGLGNPLRRDDGIGLVLLDHIKKKMSNITCEHDIDYIDAGIPGVKLIHYLPVYDMVILIDAMDFKGKPGEYVLSTPDEMISKKNSKKVSTHEEDILNVLKLAKDINQYPKEVYIFGVQPNITSVGIGLSYELDKALPSLLDALRRTILMLMQKKREI
ncbi:MAG: hydrogenase maturation protease [Candidatus Thermoplasmatota archaeon]